MTPNRMSWVVLRFGTNPRNPPAAPNMPSQITTSGLG
jgi:hypothetical protein